MEPLDIREFCRLATALAKELDRQAIIEANQLALQIAPVLEAKAKRVKEQIKEMTEAGGSYREMLTFLPSSWSQEGISFPLTSRKCEQAVLIYGIMQSWTVRHLLHTTPEEIKPLLAEALEAKRDSLEEGAQMIDEYKRLGQSWLCRYINHGAAALADFCFGRFRIGGIPLVERVTLVLEQAGLQGAQKGVNDTFIQEDSPYFAAFKPYAELVESMPAGTSPPPPRTIAQILVAAIEMEISCEATMWMELTHKDSKLRHAVKVNIVSFMRNCCKRWLAEFETVFGKVEHLNEELASGIDFDMDRALARDVILTYKERKAVAIRRREPYQSLKELCEEAGAEYKFVETFGIDQGMLPKRGRPTK